MTSVESNGSGVDAPEHGPGAEPAPSAVPASARRVEVVIVTGLSGAGRGTAARVLEDLGWYVLDNLPPEMIGRMIELGVSADPPIRQLALVMDVRSRFFTGNLSAVADQL